MIMECPVCYQAYWLDKKWRRVFMREMIACQNCARSTSNNVPKMASKLPIVLPS